MKKLVFKFSIPLLVFGVLGAVPDSPAQAHKAEKMPPEVEAALIRQCVRPDILTLLDDRRHYSCDIFLRYLQHKYGE